MSDSKKHEWFASEGSEHLVAENGATYRVRSYTDTDNYGSKYAYCELLTHNGWVKIHTLCSGWQDAWKWSVPGAIERMKVYAEKLANMGASISTVK